MPEYYASGTNARDLPEFNSNWQVVDSRNRPLRVGDTIVWSSFSIVSGTIKKITSGQYSDGSCWYRITAYRDVDNGWSVGASTFTSFPRSNKFHRLIKLEK